MGTFEQSLYQRQRPHFVLQLWRAKWIQESRITARDRTARHKNGPDIYGYGIGAEQKRGVMANRSNEHGNAGRFETGISGKLATQRIGSLQPDPLEQTP